MQRIAGLIKLVLQGGLLVVLPALVFILVFDQVIAMLVTLVEPIADLLPGNLIAQAKFPLILALILLLGASLVIGLAMQSASARRLGNWIERQTVGRLPMYKFVKTLTGGLLGVYQDQAFKPAVLVSEGNQREFVYIIEDHGNGDLTIMQPWAPSAFAGSIKIVPQDRIRPVDIPLAEVTKVLNHLGMGARKLLETSDRNRDAIKK